MTRAIADQSRTIRVPVHMGDQINKMLRISHQLTQRLGRSPTPEELAAEMEIPARKVEQMLDVARRPLHWKCQRMTRAKARWVISSKTPKAPRRPTVSGLICCATS